MGEPGEGEGGGGRSLKGDSAKEARRLLTTDELTAKLVPSEDGVICE